MLHRLLPLVILIALVIFGAFNIQSIKRNIFYALHLTPDSHESCCKEEEITKSDGKFDEEASMAIFNNKIIDYPKTSLAYSYRQEVTKEKESVVLGTDSINDDEKWIEVSIKEQRLRAYQGNKLIMEFPISSGLWSPTPKGTFSIWHKTRNQRMKGGSKELGTYYDLPNVPNNMFFFKGYAIHGAYWHNNFGHPMSHGCINSPLASVAELFEWAGPVVAEGENAAHATPENPGTRVVII